MPTKREKIAIIGAGIAGLGSAYFLHKEYEIVIFEKDNEAGGHAHTAYVEEDGEKIPINTAVVVHNEANYPYFSRLLKELGVSTELVTSTVGFQHTPSGLEYAVPHINQIFAQRRNIINIPFVLMLREILRFGKIAPEVLGGGQFADMTVSDYTKYRKFSAAFLERYLIPAAAALWSADPQLIRDFPIVSLVRYFDNHHILRAMPNTPDDQRYAWRGFIGGTNVYRDKLISHFPKAMRLNAGVKTVKRLPEGVEIITDNDEILRFDRVILACHADEALSLLRDPTSVETELLGRFRYKANTVTLHTDESVMPKNKRAWATYNSRLSYISDGSLQIEQNYHMNLLQNLTTTKNYFLAVSSDHGIDPAKILQKFSYSHPIYSVEAVGAQKRLSELNGNGRTYFCGSYFRYGFHEDAFVSALEVCRSIIGEAIWYDVESANL